ncbi:MAG: prolyl oligopeptidase family serine peptidase [Pseudomonadota bacterium]
MRKGKVIGLMLLVLAGCVSGLQLDPKRYPAAARGSTVDNYHGTRVSDPYRWMEDTTSAATQQFVTSENALTRPYLDALPRLKPIRARLEQLYHYERAGVPEREGGRYFYLHNDGKQDQSVLMVAADAAQFAAGAGRVLVDLNAARGDATISLADYVPSPDGRWLAYSISDAGSDWNTWHVLDVQTGKEQPEVLRDTKFTSVSWLHDGSGFYYSAYPGGDDKLQAVVRWHRMGQSQSQDREVFAVSDHSTRVPYGRVTEDGRYLVITLDEGSLSNGIMVMPLAGGAAQPLFVSYDGVYVYLGSRTAVGTELLFRTTAGAPNGRIVAVDLGKFDFSKPGAQQMRVVVPESTNALELSALVGDKVITSYLEDAHSTVQLFDAASDRPAGTVKLPGPGAVEGFTGRPGDTESFFSFMDFSAPRRVYRLDMPSGATTLLRQPKFAADTSPYVTEQVFYPSKDGTRIPMFLVHRKDMKRDGTNPVWLYGYGGFDVSITPWFSARTVAWLEMGGVFAVANLRGGGEYGVKWHKAGVRGNKQNVFDDFIAAAQFLAREHYTSARHIVVNGESNGGLLVGAVLTQRPDVFGVALADVGVMDMLRYHLASGNARQWADDYGLSDDPADFKAQIAYSPVHNAGQKHCYPPTLLTTAAADNRVVPWHSYKFTAALQHAQHCASPVLLRVETRAGHGAGMPVWMQIEHAADQLAFAAAALEMPGATSGAP